MVGVGVRVNVSVGSGVFDGAVVADGAGVAVGAVVGFGVGVADLAGAVTTFLTLISTHKYSVPFFPIPKTWPALSLIIHAPL